MNFDTLAPLEDNPSQLVDEVISQLIAERRWNELFEARLVAARLRLGISVADPPPLDEVPEPARSQLEQAYVDACREVGRHFADAGQYREAWHFLRPAGDKEWLAILLARVTPTAGDPDSMDDNGNLEELIEVALYEGVDPGQGYAWLIEHYGTCNSVTTLEGIAHQLPPEDMQQCAEVLVRHVWQELRDNIAGHIEHVEGTRPALPESLGDYYPGREWLFENEAVHVDASHLAATVRFARVVTDVPVLRLAHEMTDYGRRLAEIHHYDSDPPFGNLYAHHHLLFAASLGKQVDAAVEHFSGEAARCDVETQGTAAIETLLVLLNRLDRPGEALDAYAQYVTAAARLSPFAPKPVDLARQSGNWDVYLEKLKQNDDPVAVAVALATKNAG